MSKFKKAIKKVAKNPVAQAIANPIAYATTVAPAQLINKGLQGLKPPSIDEPKYDNGGVDQLNQLAAEEEAKRKALGLKQQTQINQFADEQQRAASMYRDKLAKSLADASQQTFQRANPALLEDLNSRGLFTSQTARDQEQGRLLSDLAREQNQQLSDFDTNVFSNINDIKGAGISALLGGDQSALDSALALRKAGIQRSFDQADIEAQNAFAKQLAKRQSYDNLLGSLLGTGGSIFGSYLGRK